MVGDEQYGIISPDLAIDSMRRNGYITTDMAIAELIDNSIDAGATEIEVLLFEDEVQLQRTVSRIARIGVVDNGTGMSAEELRQGLRFGGGANAAEREGIGRFGFGLPNSSISQANRTDIWSWQNGPGNAVWTYLDVGEIQAGEYVQVPAPEVGYLPEDVRRISTGLDDSGTYVEWSDLDEDITWKRGQTVLQHTESLVGRIYRHYLRRESEPVEIRMVVVSPGGNIERERRVSVNDPLYLMRDTSCPWDEEPMFQQHTQYPFEMKDKHGRVQSVEVTISYARPECRQTVGGEAAGSQPHGQHAKRNIGVSIVRAGRELQLENVVRVDPYRDRWWGVEIAFPPELDELFGVSNNKQRANRLVSALETFDSDEDRSVRGMLESGDLARDEDRVDLYRLAQWIHEQVRSVANLVQKQNVGERSNGEKRHDEPSVEDRASKVVKQRAEQEPTEEEKKEREEPTPRKEQVKAGKEALVEEGYSEADAEAIMEVALDRDRRVLFVEAHPDRGGEAIFDIKQLPGGRVEVLFNPNHPAHSHIFETLEADVGELSSQELRQRCVQASDSLKLLFAAWVRLELEARKGKERSAFARVRRDWGRMAADFLEPDYGDALAALAEEE